MPPLPTGEPVWNLQFNENGQLTSPDQGSFLAEVAASGVTDLFAFSHGWGTSQNSAGQLYGQMFPMIRNAANGLPGLGKLGFAGIYWPSLWFPPTQATPAAQAGAQQADAGAQVTLSAGTAALSGADIAAALRPGFADPAQADAITQIGQLIDEGESAAGLAESDDAKQQRLQQIAQLVRSLTPPPPPDGEFEDSGETAVLLSDDPAADYQAAADAFGTAAPAGAEQGIGDWFGKAINGAKDVLRVFSYNTMKARAGTVGRNGLGPLLAALHAASPAVRVHLIGHSFGARLVSFSLSGVGAPASSPVASLLLLQGAFSHWCFAHAQDNPFGSPGALNGYPDRVHGPLVATHTVYDWAVGVWYPKASFLAQQDTEAVVADRWGGMGADGYQAVKPAEDTAMPSQGGTSYGFAPGIFYRVDAASVINNTAGEPFAGAHSDIRKSQVAQLAAAAAAAHA
jgi:hypothetical protein